MRSEERKPVVTRQDWSQQRGYYGRALQVGGNWFNIWSLSLSPISYHSC